MSSTVLIRCDGSPEIGFGHVSRCLAIARELTALGPRVLFAVRRDPVAISLIEKHGFAVVSPSKAELVEWLRAALRETGAKALLVDARDELRRTDLEDLHSTVGLIVSLDDLDDRRLAADFCVYPPVPQVAELDWSGYRGRVLSGWEWVPLRRQFAQAPAWQPRARHLLVTMGGSDPAGLTLLAVDALALVDGAWSATVVVGPGFRHGSELEDRVRGSQRIEVRRGVEEMAPLMAEAEVTIASFGVTAYELAAVGTPAIHISLTDDHRRSASAFERAQIAVNLGEHHTVTPRRLADAVNGLLRDPDRRARMSRDARSLVDGRGSARIANEIVKHMDERA